MDATLRSRPTAGEYIARRLGSGTPREVTGRMFQRSFTARSLRGFWRYWNPVYGFFLLYYCYRPLRRVVSPAVALLSTFAVCGFFLHDIFYWPFLTLQRGHAPLPFVTCWFLIIATCILLTEYLHVSFDRLGPRTRVLLHLAFLVGTLSLTAYIAGVV